MTITEVCKRFDLTPDTLRYYERVGMIPPVTRNKQGIRDYTATDISWVEMAKCMRQAGVSVEMMIEYVRLYQQGDETLTARLELLKNQMDELLEKRRQFDETIARLEYKVSRYEMAVLTGVLTWDEEEE